ncbi:MAG: hypothetical protein AA931_09250 [Peptococcaceae bacterium 1109]|nr:MAG: hypothetical protein AA931_09250 [Peptococcaceae bacterium 1109]
MRKRVSVWLLAFSAVLVMSMVVSAAPTKITFWHIYDGGEVQSWMKDVVRRFNEANPDIIVEDLGVNFWDYWTKIATATAAGIAPDVAMNDLGNVGQRAHADMIIPLDEYMAQSGVTLDEFWPATHSVIIWDGQVYAMPWETDVRVLYYNKAAFREVGLDPESPPQTWDELKEYADLLTSRDSNGRLTRIGFHPNLSNMYWWIFAWQNGATLVDDEGKIELYTPEAVEALEYVKSFLDTYGLRELTSFTSTFGGDAMDPFLIGKVAMVGNNNTFRETILRYAPDMEFGVARLPHNGTPASWSNGFSLEISSQSKNPEAAWRFLSYLMSPEIQAEYAKVNSSLVGSIAGSTDEELMADPSWRVMIDEMGVSRFRPFSLEAPTWYDSSLSPELDAVYQGMKDPDQALRDAQKNYEDEVARWHRTHR